MIPIVPKIIVLITAIAYGLGVPSTRCTAAFVADAFRVGDPLPQLVVDAWKKRRELCSSVHWKVKGRELVIKGFLNGSPDDSGQFGLLPKEDEWRQTDSELWIDFPSRRVRSYGEGTMHVIEPDGKTWLKPDRSLWLFDGVHLQDVRLDGNGHVSIRDPDGRGQGAVFDGGLVPLFWGAGILFGPDAPWGINGMDRQIDTRKYRIAAVRREGEMTHLTVRVNTSPASQNHYYEYGIDLAKDCAITEMYMSLKDHKYLSLAAEWSKTDLGWQPTSWKRQTYRGDGAVDLAGEFEVITRECNPNLSQVEFQMVPKPGTAIWDEKANRNLAKGEPGQPDIPWEMHVIQQSARTRRTRWLVAGTTIVVCLGGAAWWWRRRSV